MKEAMKAAYDGPPNRPPSIDTSTIEAGGTIGGTAQAVERRAERYGSHEDGVISEMEE
jgi:hypothetical protein